MIELSLLAIYSSEKCDFLKKTNFSIKIGFGTLAERKMTIYWNWNAEQNATTFLESNARFQRTTHPLITMKHIDVSAATSIKILEYSTRWKILNSKNSRRSSNTRILLASKSKYSWVPNWLSKRIMGNLWRKSDQRMPFWSKQNGKTEAHCKKIWLSKGNLEFWCPKKSKIYWK